ncbi:MAG: glycosyltransferase family 9 protein [Ignavibacterium sp.]|nr:glycosyltransferase family 9 protein [Ignavibacterium sp.]
MTVEELSKLKKILIIRLSSLGDILLTTPFVRTIKTQFPKIKIDMLIREEYADVIKFNPYLNNKLFFKKNDQDYNRLIEQLRDSRYELVIDLQNNLRSKKVASSLNIKTVKFDKRSFDKFLLVKFKINKLKQAPPIPVRYSSTINDFKLDKEGLDLFTDKSASTIILDKKNLIGFCPGARHFTKRWPEKYFVELGNLLINNGYSLALFGGKIDKEICARLSHEIPGIIDLSNEDDLLQTAADMKLCEAVVCNDSGLMHVASAVKTNVIAIFGSSVKVFGFAPYNCNNLILENNFLNCRPCSHIGRSSCPKKHFDCMNLTNATMVFENLKTILKQR